MKGTRFNPGPTPRTAARKSTPSSVRRQAPKTAHPPSSEPTESVPQIRGFPIPFPLMEALSVKTLPTGDSCQYEPKWERFRCLIFKKGRQVYLQSKAGRPLTRYFPEIVDAVRALPAATFVLD